jgi:hypothetical protein
VQILSGLNPAPDESECAELQITAAKAMLTFRVLLHVTQAGGPIKPEVTICGVGFDPARRPETIEGDSNGWVITPPLRRNRMHLLSIKAGQYRRTLRISATGHAPVKKINVSFYQPPRLPEQASNVVRILRGDETIVSERIESPARLAANAALLVGSKDDNGDYRLTNAQRILSAGVITVQTLNVAPSQLPQQIDVGDMVIYESGGMFRKATTSEWDSVMAPRLKLQGIGGA